MLYGDTISTVKGYHQLATVKGYHQHCGGYNQYCRGILSVLFKNTIIYVGDTISDLEDVQYCGERPSGLLSGGGFRSCEAWAKTFCGAPTPGKTFFLILFFAICNMCLICYRKSK